MHTTQQLGRPTNAAPTKRTLGFHSSCTSTDKKRPGAGNPWKGGFGVTIWGRYKPLQCTVSFIWIKVGRLPWVWPPGSNHAVRQDQHYTQSLCNNHPFTFAACFLNVCVLSKVVFSLKLHLCVKFLQPQGHKN